MACAAVRESAQLRLGNGVIEAAIKIILLCKGFSGLIELVTGTVKCDGDVIDKI